MGYNAKNYTEQGGEVTHIGGRLVLDDGAEVRGAGVVDNMAALTSATNSIADLREKFNDLLTLLKDGGLMAGDSFALTYSAVTTDTGHDDRMYNTGKIGGVAVDNDAHTVTITLTERVADLRDFDGLHGWGTHKWLGIGLVSGVDYPTDTLKYNDTALTADDASEASGCGCTGTGAFVRWVAADLVLAGDNSQRSVDTFTLWAPGHAETTYRLAVVEPSE